MGCPIRTSTDQSLLAAPHGFSQRATSFIASWCQGIHRMPFSRSNPPTCTGTTHNRDSPMTTGRSRTSVSQYNTHIWPPPAVLTHRHECPHGSDQPGPRCETDAHQPLHTDKEHDEHQIPRTTGRRIRAPPHARDPIWIPSTHQEPSDPHGNPGITLVEADGIEPTTPCLQSRCSPS